MQLIVAYLGIGWSSRELIEILGMPERSIEVIRSGLSQFESSRREHVRSVSAVVGGLRDVRLAATNATERGKDARDWLHTARIKTSRGVKTPLEILSDDSLTDEVLLALNR